MIVAFILGMLSPCSLLPGLDDLEATHSREHRYKKMAQSASDCDVNEK